MTLKGSGIFQRHKEYDGTFLNIENTTPHPTPKKYHLTQIAQRTQIVN